MATVIFINSRVILYNWQQTGHHRTLTMSQVYETVHLNSQNSNFTQLFKGPTNDIYILFVTISPAVAQTSLMIQ